MTKPDFGIIVGSTCEARFADSPPAWPLDNTTKAAREKIACRRLTTANRI